MGLKDKSVKSTPAAMLKSSPVRKISGYLLYASAVPTGQTPVHRPQR